MSDTPNKPARRFNTKASVMIIASSSVAESAKEVAATFEAADTTLNALYFTGLSARIDQRARTILGVDNLQELRNSSKDLEAYHKDAFFHLGLTKTLIETKYTNNPGRRDELLTNLGFTKWYAAAGKESQEDMGQLLNRFTQNLISETLAELTAKGLPPARVTLLNTYAATYNKLNAKQEISKDTSIELSDADIIALNSIYDEVIAICKLGQRLFKEKPATHDRFVFDKLTAQQSSYHTNAPDPSSPDAPSSEI